MVKRIAVPTKGYTSFSEERMLWIPWWHTSYLISGSLVRDNELRYPDLRSGEDPVFMANVLVKSRSIAMIEEVVYLYRKYPKTTGTSSNSFEQVLDYLKHAEIVRKLYEAGKKEYWDHGYGPFLKEDTRKLINRCNLESDQRHHAESEMERVWKECND